MDGIEVPAASPPSAPCRLSTGLLSSSPSFACHAEELEELKEASRQLQDTTNTGRQLAFLALARLQRSDMDGAQEAFASIGQLPTPAQAVGGKFWRTPEVRLNLCQSSGFSHFMETLVTALGLDSFFRTGVLTPKVPEKWLVGVRDYDDELYLLGVIGALRELERFAVNRGQELDLRSVRICLRTAMCLEQALMQFSFRNSDLRQRFDSVKYVVKRLESVAYEIDLALQRAAATAVASGEEPPVQASEAVAETTVQAVDMQLLEGIKTNYDAFDEQREQVMKRSRDIVKNSKNAIYALHRNDYSKADDFLQQCSKEAAQMHAEIISKYPRLREGFFSGTLEEFAEAHVYRAFKADRKLLTFQELQQKSGFDFPLLLTEYLGGLMDLTGEVNRMAVRSASGGRKAKPTVELCRACVDAVYSGLQELPALPGKLTKKLGPLRQTLMKIDGVLYELALLSQGVRAAGVEDVGDAEAMKD